MPAAVAASPNLGGTLVEVRGASKSFGETRALRGCNFSARAGEVHAVVGENGSGKSTLAKLLAGVLRPDSGSVQVDGAPPGSPGAARARGIAVVFQEVLVAEGASVLDNLYIGDDRLFLARRSQRQKRAAAEILLNRLIGAPVPLDAPVEELSLNTRQWVVIARALIGNPRVVVFDESTAALDHASVERFFSMVRELRASGASVLIVTHRINELTAICDRATVLSDGADVGTLAGGEITEERLLELMQGDARARVPGHVPAARLPRASSPGAAALVVSNLRLTPAAPPIDLTVGQGEIVGLAGLEGHGQVAFIQAVSGIRRGLGGSVQVARDGGLQAIDSAASADRANLAYIPGDRKAEGTFSNLSVFENFGIACYRRTAWAGLVDRRRVMRMFQEQVGRLSIRVGSAAAPIHSLSGGNQQKIVVGRALAAAPLVLALNDPTRGVDIGAKRDLYALLRRLAEEGKAIVFLSNEIEEFVGLCHRVVVFRSHTVSDVLVGNEITADLVLAAMFGHAAVAGRARVQDSA
ncbi:MAG: sugar ABC transporter ATP-binding protein [Acetobacteraceae bacterium]